MELRIDRQALVPVVQQIVDGLAVWLRQSEVQPGTRLPSARHIARVNLLSQSSVVEACERLVTQGVLAPRHGAGFIVATPTLVAQGQQDCLWFEGAELKQGGCSGELKLGCGGLPESWRETDDLSYAIRQVSRTDMAGLFNYSTSRGLPALRLQILKRLGRLGIEVDENRILTTAGASQGLDLIVRTLLKPGDCVVVESPGYPLLFDLLRLHGVTMIEVPRTPRGPDTEQLQLLLLKHRPRALFINSFYHNPTGSCLTPAMAQQVLQLTKTHGVLVIEDDVYADLHYGPGTRLAALGGDDNVIYVGSYSKTLSSSLRVGFVVASEGVISRLAEVKMISSMGASRFCESVLTCLLASGAYRKLVQRQRQRLNTDREAALQVLEDAEWEVFGKPAGGLFIWARSRMSDYAQVRKQARRCGVLLSSATAFSPDGQAKDWQRINVAYACDPRARAFFQATAANRPKAF
ncbi:MULTISPECIES: PLP-dependent aminotransferase family protein [Pseudomonas]|jgi:DNA-binding transcriptional MocR family regulator|uniref:DNA-binding transcriptional regulator, MocR family, contains an aminotransferase domain n=2 Tax=Pseudomonas fluorescens group TaxID=136843 RepID=A0AB36CRH3_9PSED|nr:MULTISPECIES: PLP-dependent aminotransferase family protein [Pseudomonas]MDF9879592.1 DNA-binding transcriptional MocR family regulator [Pseudomonas silensiensis]MDI1331924.1 PLP-dependent aminotransferase family protein [Pseudomonas sp.]MSU93485.1 PLP-dependent aminotransferase family protein [Pseudomonas mandelii]NMZ78652.1 PLP-dependent aminotransferase family protein [Pseudomonas mandelii]TWC16273.1 GntR family transcriptional regulator [Pseudomonas sp. SJZ083]